MSEKQYKWSDFYLFNAKLGPKWFIKGVNYWRLVEYPWVANQLNLVPDGKLLDIGSASYNLVPLLLAKEGYSVYATDIDSRVQRLKKVFPYKNLVVEEQDATNLGYDQCSFDNITAISVIEHIPNDGDTLAIKQMARVLRKGGRAIITVPFNKEYKETFVKKDVYSKEFTGEPIFYQRHYDRASLNARLIKPSDLKLAHIEYFGERIFHFENFFDRLPLALTIPIRWLMPLFTKLFTVKLKESEIDQAMAACIVLEK